MQPGSSTKNPTASMYGIASYIYHKNQPFMYVGKYTIRGWWGNGKLLGKFQVDTFGDILCQVEVTNFITKKRGGPLYMIPPSKIGMPLQPPKIQQLATEK